MLLIAQQVTDKGMTFPDLELLSMTTVDLRLPIGGRVARTRKVAVSPGCKVRV
jgi:hypothetical protein